MNYSSKFRLFFFFFFRWHSLERYSIEHWRLTYSTFAGRVAETQLNSEHSDFRLTLGGLKWTVSGETETNQKLFFISKFRFSGREDIWFGCDIGLWAINLYFISLHSQSFIYSFFAANTCARIDVYMKLNCKSRPNARALRVACFANTWIFCLANLKFLLPNFCSLLYSFLLNFNESSSCNRPSIFIFICEQKRKQLK